MTVININNKAFDCYVVKVNGCSGKFERQVKNYLKKRFSSEKKNSAVSYSYPYCTIINSDIRVSVDIETKHIDDKYGRIFLTEKEMDLIYNSNINNAYRIWWTKKEAALKYIGVGFKYGFKSVEIGESIVSMSENITEEFVNKAIVSKDNELFSISICGELSYIDKAEFILKEINKRRFDLV